MASLLTFPRAPQCFSCLKSIFLETSAPAFNNSFRTQWRGKKKLPKKTTIHVKLLRDVAGYGRKGTFVPVAPSRMRNYWYPQRRADYATVAEQRENPELVLERDYTYGLKADAQKANENQEGEEQVQVTLLAPDRATELLREHVPEVIEFFRQPIQTPPTTAGDPNAPSSPIPSTAIYGSVSTADLAATVRAVLALRAAETGDTDAARVVVVPEDIKILSGNKLSESGLLGTLDEAERVKSLGDWDVVIQARGGGEVRRRMRVLPMAAGEDVPLPEETS